MRVQIIEGSDKRARMSCHEFLVTAWSSIPNFEVDCVLSDANADDLTDKIQLVEKLDRDVNFDDQYN